MASKKAQKIFHYFIAAILIIPAVFLMIKNAIALSIVFFLGFFVFTSASSQISPKSPFRLAKTGKITVGVVFVIGVLIGATIDAERLVPSSPEEIAQREAQERKETYIKTIKKASEYVSDVNVSESETEISITLKRAWDEASFFEKAGDAMWQITQHIREDIPTYASNQLLFVLYAPFESGIERTATITYRPEGLEANPLLFERVNTNGYFLNAADRVITHQGQAGKRYLTGWCDNKNNEIGADVFCEKVRGQ